MRTAELLKILKRHGVFLLREGGRHSLYYSPLTGKKIPVSRHAREIPAGTALRILKEGFPAGCYSVDFPGMDACYTFGATMEEALEMAEDVLNLRMVEAEDAGEKIPAPPSLESIKVPPSSCLTLIQVDTLAYRKRNDTRAVKKTLSIPRWLDTLAQKKNINFSNVLQRALMREMGIGG